MKFEDLTPEQQAEAKACETPEQLHALAKKLGHKLTDDELDSLAGGGTWDDCGEHYQNFGCNGLDACYTMVCDSFTCKGFAGHGKNFSCDHYTV